MNSLFELIFKNMRGIIGIFIVLGAFGFLFLIIYKEIPLYNRDLLLFSAGIVLGMAKDVTAYLYGSSKDKSDQEKAERALEGVDDPKKIV